MRMKQSMEIINRKDRSIVDEITKFCIDYGIFKGVLDIGEIKANIEEQLDNAEFIESLINTIIVNTVHRGNIDDIEKVKTLLLKLEKMRLELEYTDRRNNKHEQYQ